METGNFNLDAAIKTHVENLQNKGSITAADGIELSSHLYDSSEALIKQQLTVEEAFIISAKRLGTDDVLHNEYSKVNTSLNVNRTWAYMILGFNLLYAAPLVVFTLLVGASNWMLRMYSASITTTVVVTTLNICACIAMIYAVMQKHRIARFIENFVEKQPLRTVAWSFFLPVSITFISSFLFPGFTGPNINSTMIASFHSSWVERSFYLVFITFALAAISLVASISKFEKLSLKSLVERPAMTFLFISGAVVEILAASTRTIRLPHNLPQVLGTIFSCAIFGVVYMAFSALISFYNEKQSWRYLVVFAVAGFTIETSAGINADMNSGNTYFTVFHVSALVLGVIAGKYIGEVLRNKNHTLA
ncbi:hypothetical protein [Mucilaginibacter sp. HD30]